MQQYQVLYKRPLKTPRLSVYMHSHEMWNFLRRKVLA